MALSLPSKHKQGQTPQYVAFIVVCKGIPFYGYHVGYRPFLKIYMVNPLHKSRLSQCLRSGAVLGTEFDVFEDHIPFLLQFMLDANLYGCGWVEVGECLFREDVPGQSTSISSLRIDTHTILMTEYVPPKESEALFTPPPTSSGPYAHRVYVDLTVPPFRFHPAFSDGGPEKVSYSPLELDLPASAILNRHGLIPRNIHHDFIEKLHPEMVEKGKLVRSVKELWDDERRRRTARGESGPYDLRDDAPREFDDRDPSDTIWRTEPTLRAKIEERAKEDLGKYRTKMGPKGKGAPEFETYVDEKERMEGKKTSWMDMVRTTFEQVNAIYISRFEEDEDNAYPFGAWAVGGVGLGITAEQEREWEREVDVGRLAASQAAVKVARDRARQQASKKGEEDDEDIDEGGLEFGLVGYEEEDGRGPPATQAEALRRARVEMDRAERRGREASIEEGEWEKEPDEDEEEEANFWGLANADTASERAMSDYSASPEVPRSSTTSPVKPSPSVSPSKRSHLSIEHKLSDSDEGGEEEDGMRRSKRVKEKEREVTVKPQYVTLFSSITSNMLAEHA